MKANVYVTLKKEVLDPQGDAVRRALVSLGFDAVKSVRVGKLIEIDVAATDKAAVEKRIHEMGQKLLANAVIEDFRVEIE